MIVGGHSRGPTRHEPPRTHQRDCRSKETQTARAAHISEADAPDRGRGFWAWLHPDGTYAAERPQDLVCAKQTLVMIPWPPEPQEVPKAEPKAETNETANASSSKDVAEGSLIENVHPVGEDQIGGSARPQDRTDPAAGTARQGPLQQNQRPGRKCHICRRRPKRLIPCRICGVMMGPRCCAVGHTAGAADGICVNCHNLIQGQRIHPQNNVGLQQRQGTADVDLNLYRG